MVGKEMYAISRVLSACAGFLLAVLCFSAAPIALAMASIYPQAVRLGARLDSPALQGALAQAILLAHLLCFASILVFLTIQLSLSIAQRSARDD